MNALLRLVSSEGRILLRDHMALFFTLLFPLVFILVFGFLMGDIGDVSRATMGLLAPPTADRAALNAAVRAAGTMAVVEFADPESIEDALLDRSIDFALVWNGDELAFLYDAGRVQENYAFQQVARGITTAFNLKRQGAAPPIAVEAIEVGKASSTGWFSLVLPGILAFSVLSAGLFAVSGHVTAMKERKILDRLVVTPMRPVALLAAIVTVRLAIVYVSTLITLFVGITVFGLRYEIRWLHFALFIAAATVGTMGLGTIIALVVRRPSSASNVANAASMLMMFLAGIYFPTEFMPAALQAVSRAMPLTHMANALRYALGVVDMAESEFWSITAAFLAVAAFFFPVLARYVVRPLRR